MKDWKLIFLVLSFWLTLWSTFWCLKTKKDKKKNETKKKKKEKKPAAKKKRKHPILDFVFLTAGTKNW